MGGHDPYSSSKGCAELLIASYRNSYFPEEKFNEQLHEANYLKLDCAKAHLLLLWWPKWNLDFTLKKIVDWHKAEIEGKLLKKECLEQIVEYTHGGA